MFVCVSYTSVRRGQPKCEISDWPLALAPKPAATYQLVRCVGIRRGQHSFYLHYTQSVFPRCDTM